MAKAKFERKKPHLNVGTIGHVDHGNVYDRGYAGRNGYGNGQAYGQYGGIGGVY